MTKGRSKRVFDALVRTDLLSAAVSLLLDDASGLMPIALPDVSRNIRATPK